LPVNHFIVLKKGRINSSAHSLPDIVNCEVDSKSEVAGEVTPEDTGARFEFFKDHIAEDNQ